MKRSWFVASAAALTAAACLRDIVLAATSDLNGSGLTPVVETVLPFGAPSFPAIAVSSVVQRIDALFKLSESPAFRASLNGFSLPALFPVGSAQLFAAETAVTPEARITDLVARDAKAFATAGLSLSSTFEDFSDVDRAAYFALWSQSAFSARRRFYGSLRTIVFVAFYSMPDVWPAIGYGGPLLGKAPEK
jgi:hypothetical protein